MTHRYGRHGNKAWLRWRKKRFQHVALALPPQVAVLHVPLEFLNRIRKVTILMSDGTEMNIQAQAADPMEIHTEPRLNGVGPIQSPQDKYYTAARNMAKDQVISIFGTRDPYNKKPDMPEVKASARSLYYVYGLDQLQFGQNVSLREAQDNFINEFKEEYSKVLVQLSREHEAPTEETQQLLVAARTDKEVDRGNVPPYAQHRAIARASVSLFSNTALRQEDINEEILRNLHERIGLYQKFYDEFEPTKEED